MAQTKHQRVCLGREIVVLLFGAGVLAKHVRSMRELGALMIINALISDINKIVANLMKPRGEAGARRLCLSFDEILCNRGKRIEERPSARSSQPRFALSNL